MADDIFETDEQETLEMDEVLEKVISYCAEEAKEKLAQVGSFEPFTVVVEGENMHIESHPGDDVDVIRARAREAVATASGFASHYCFCFDGFVDTAAAFLEQAGCIFVFSGGDGGAEAFFQRFEFTVAGAVAKIGELAGTQPFQSGLGVSHDVFLKISLNML